MRIQFDLPDGPAQLLLRLVAHIRQHANTEADAAQVCQSMIVDILLDDAIEHGIITVEHHAMN